MIQTYLKVLILLELSGVAQDQFFLHWSSILNEQNVGSEQLLEYMQHKKQMNRLQEDIVMFRCCHQT